MKIFILMLVVGSCLFADQLTKGVARQQLASAQGVSVLHGVFGLKYAENTGAFMSLGAGMRETAKIWLFTVLVAMVLLTLLMYILVSPKIGGFSLLCGSLVIAGGMSNLLDRLMHDGAVIDFLFISLGGMRSGIFNLADVMISIGLAGWLALQARQVLQTKRAQGKS